MFAFEDFISNALFSLLGLCGAPRLLLQLRALLLRGERLEDLRPRPIELPRGAAQGVRRIRLQPEAGQTNRKGGLCNGPRLKGGGGEGTEIDFAGLSVVATLTSPIIRQIASPQIVLSSFRSHAAIAMYEIAFASTLHGRVSPLIDLRRTNEPKHKRRPRFPLANGGRRRGRRAHD